ncbi:hypothetical protein LTR37_017358 [Vermiconidia calcicola]|uniref:Uncharacterized protein n=1 Tax=Vermiconidia calcicola TaxID=1690605 RepID=A0ACC3MLR2_9PEZI|nr:hypothetical protein LTR37_017358 [Vermiconidia calcicola]
MDGKLHEDNDSASNDNDGFKIRGAAARSKPGGKPTKDATTETCTICLESISERAVAVPCNHLTFDFLCLISWLQERSTCPLCTLAVTEVQYDFRSPEDYKTYRPPKPDANNISESAFQRSRRRRGQDLVRRRAERWNLSPAQAAASGEDPALERRRRVYRDKLFSLHVGANRISQYRDFTYEDFGNSPELQSRARMFLRRELKVFSFLDAAAVPRGGNREFLLEYIVAILKTSELKGASGHAEDLLADYLGRDNARLLLHELEAWLRSPYTALEAWDRHVQYADRGRSIGSKRAGLS